MDSDTVEKLIKKDEGQVSKLTEDEQTKLKPIIEGVVAKEKYSVVFAPYIITLSNIICFTPKIDVVASSLLDHKI